MNFPVASSGQRPSWAPSRPARIAEILHYGDPRPRTVATLSEPGLIQAKKLSLEIFQREVRR